jgi:parallel beta helix pectate lyase-like protein
MLQRKSLGLKQGGKMKKIMLMAAVALALTTVAMPGTVQTAQAQYGGNPLHCNPRIKILQDSLYTDRTTWLYAIERTFLASTYTVATQDWLDAVSRAKTDAVARTLRFSRPPLAVAGGFRGGPPNLPGGLAFYVSPSGSDTNDGLSPAFPFATLTRAQTAVRASAFKTIYLMNGTFQVTAPLVLTSFDNGEAWLAYPGHQPLLDGRGTVLSAFNVAVANGIRIDGLSLTNFVKWGIYADAVTGLVVRNNTITNIASNGWNQAAIYIQRSSTGANISFNTIDHTNYAGIWVGANVTDNMSNLTIMGNLLTNTMLTVADGGAIYLLDRNHSSTNILVSGNVVGDRGSGVKHTVGIYLDDDLSNATVVNNVVYGTGVYGVQIHGGDHNTLQSNIFDVTNSSYLGKYNSTSLSFGMGSNVFAYNIIYSGTSRSASLWQNAYGSNTPLDINHNGYSTVLSNTTGADSSPTIVDPSFVDVANHNYNMTTQPMTGFTLRIHRDCDG